MPDGVEMRDIWGFLGAIAVSAFCLSPIAANAQTVSQKVNIALKQATLLEGLSQNACFAMSGLNQAQARADALELLDGFSTALAGLREGHQWLDLLPETDPGVIGELDKSDASWNSLRPAIQQLVNKDYHSVVIYQFLKNQPLALAQARGLADKIIDAHGAALLPDDRVGLREAAAHRMRTQQVLRELCFVINEIGGAEMKVALAQTVSRIDARFVTLSEGGEGVPAAPNARIKRNLRTAALFWDKMRPGLDVVLRGEVLAEPELAKLLKLNRSVLKQLNQAVEGYLTPS